MYIAKRPFIYTNAQGQTVEAQPGEVVANAGEFPTLRALLNLKWLEKQEDTEAPVQNFLAPTADAEPLVQTEPGAPRRRGRPRKVLQ